MCDLEIIERKKTIMFLNYILRSNYGCNHCMLSFPKTNLKQNAPQLPKKKKKLRPYHCAKHSSVRKVHTIIITFSFVGCSRFEMLWVLSHAGVCFYLHLRIGPEYHKKPYCWVKIQRIVLPFCQCVGPTPALHRECTLTLNSLLKKWLFVRGALIEAIFPLYQKSREDTMSLFENTQVNTLDSGQVTV